MSTATEPHPDPSSSAAQPSPAPSTAGSVGTPGSNNNNARPASQSSGPVGHVSFRRQRASRACETCHARKVRCDAASLGVPCTNCVAFSIECRIPTPKRKKNQAKAKEANVKEPGDVFEKREVSAVPQTSNRMAIDDMLATSAAEPLQLQLPPHNPPEGQFMKPRFSRAPIKDAGRVAHLGESSNLSLLVQDRHGSTDVVHYPLPANVRGSRARLTDLDNLEIDILHQRGAFLLPPKSLCDELVEAYFKWVAPIVPIVNRSRFMRQYRDPKNPPSLLLLQAILLAGSKVCYNPQLMDANGSTTPAAMTFYKRAKALYDANYEDDRVTIVQALVLLGWYWEGPEDVTKNVFYWTRVATIVAQGSGMHRSVESSQLSKADKRLWKRIWWTLFTRDRSVATAMGRPTGINTDDSDVGMLTEDDFIEDDVDSPAEYPPDPVHVQFFLQYVKLCEIMGLVLSQQYSVGAKSRRMNAMDLTHSDMALADWLQNCPKELCWQRSRHHFLAALLHANYYTTLCLLHRAHMPPASSTMNNYRVEEIAYPSRTIAFQAAAMITSIIDTLQAHHELMYAPAFIIYSLFSALIMHVYQMRSSVPSIVATCQERIQICMQALKDISRVWLAAKMIHTLFESILGNKVLEERLQKAAGKKHQKIRQDQQQQNQQQQHPLRRATEAPKRKFDDMDLGLPNGGPTPPVSYERSRPQTPAATPSRDLGQAQSTSAQQTSPTAHRPHQETASGATAGFNANTRPTTPFNGHFSLPATPPDLFLVTRTSPNLSPSLWENFQPDQLFPDGAAMFPELNSTTPPSGAVDPQLQMPGQIPSHNMQQTPTMMNQAQQVSSRNMGNQGASDILGMHMSDTSLQNTQQQHSPQSHRHEQQQNVFGIETHHGIPIQHMNTALGGTGPDGASQDDSWSNSSRTAPTAPTTLNVEDWFQFFGIHGGFSDLTS
ncbi:Cutinase transcription factor 1 alpha [Monascus purpureus]|nr:Cutinase transcription factor 1 alpha [Monascus purpureus]